MKTNYKDAVKEARALVAGMKSNRLRIAELALEVCDKGGNQHTARKGPSLNQFSTDIGVDRTTLVQWIGALSKFREENPKAKPKAEDFKVYAKKHAERPDSERDHSSCNRPAFREHRMIRAALTDVNTLNEFLKEQPDLKLIDIVMLNELKVKLLSSYTLMLNHIKVPKKTADK